MPKYFDYLASYNFKASFLFSYFSPGIMDVANRPLPKDFIKTKTGAAPILWIAKNCRATNGREHYIEKLMEYIDVDSYGECLNNKDFPSDQSRLDLISEYKFYLAVENCNCEDYGKPFSLLNDGVKLLIPFLYSHHLATEKLFDTLAHSAVPIVDGPPSYEGYIPTERSVIYMDAYPDPKDLADYIHYLDKNDTAYLEYLAFRRDAINVAPKDRLQPAFISNWSDTYAHKERSSYCSVCRGLVPWWEARLNDQDYTLDQKKDRFLVDQSCQTAGKWNYIADSDGSPYTPHWTPRPRDEFTRPPPPAAVNDSLDDYEMITPRPITQEEYNDKSRDVFVANGCFLLLFFVFITFLYRESKKSSQRLQEPIV